MGDTMLNKWVDGDGYGERGATGLETMIILGCFVIVFCIFAFGMFGALEQTEREMSGHSDGMHTACVTLCRARFLDGATDVCKFNACIAKCDAKYR